MGGKEWKGTEKRWRVNFAVGGKDEVHIIAGDHNTQIERGHVIEGVKGRCGLHTPTNEAGEHLLECCQEHGLAFGNSFSARRRKGTL